MKTIKVEWCENFIKSVFTKRVIENGGIEVNCFWKLAEESGLWLPDTYGTPMSEALSKLTSVVAVSDKRGNFLYNVFKLHNLEG